jgi:hypothetical protein
MVCKIADYSLFQAAELDQGDVLGVKGVGRAARAGGLPCDFLEDTDAQQPDPQPAHAVELRLGILLVTSPRRTAW